MNKPQLRELLEKYEKGACSEEERETLHGFFDSFQNDKEIWEELGLSKKNRFRAEIFDKLNDQIEKRESRSSIGKKYVWRIAASVIAVLGIGILSFFLLQNKPAVGFAQITKSAERGQKLTVKLPDGSVVRINAESSITYTEDFSTSRNITLKGEAFFDVKRDPDNPFTVLTGDVKTAVLGTSFNISAYADQKDIKVTVATGKVKVGSASQTVELVPGQQATYEFAREEMTVGKVDVEKLLAWKDGILVFDGNTLEEIADELMRWYGVEITFKTAQQSRCDLRLTFDNASLQMVLDQLKMVAGIDYRFADDGRVEIIGTGCIN